MGKITREVKGPFLIFLPFNGGERKEEVCVDDLFFGGLSEVLDKLTDEELKEIAFSQLSNLTKEHFTISPVKTRLASGDLPIGPNIFWLKSKTHLTSTLVLSRKEVLPETQILLSK